METEAATPIVHCVADDLVDISELKLHTKNANKHPDDQIERLAKILRFQGFRSPVIVSNLSGCVVAGHGRIEASKANGWTHVPVNYQDFESEDQEVAHLHADNSIASWAELDLSAINAQMGDFGPDFDLELLGLKSFVLDPSEMPDIDLPEEKKPKLCQECGAEQ